VSETRCSKLKLKNRDQRPVVVSLLLFYCLQKKILVYIIVSDTIRLVTEEKFSLHFNGNFPCGPGLAGTRMSPFWILLELRVMEI